jgi:hypothetical protein
MTKISTNERLKKERKKYFNSKNLKNKISREESNHIVDELWNNKKLMIPIMPILPKRPFHPNDFLRLLALQYGMAKDGVKITNDRREILSNYSGAWIGIEGYVADAKIVNGILRICISLPRLVTQDENASIIIDSHIWIKMSDFQHSDIQDGFINNQNFNHSDKNINGEVSLGDFIQFIGLVCPYITGKKVKYGFSKVKQISNGVILYTVQPKGKQREEYSETNYHRLGFLIRARKIKGTEKFSYQFADWNQIKTQKNKLEKLWNFERQIKEQY